MTCLTRVDGSVEIGSGGFNFDGHSSSLENTWEWNDAQVFESKTGEVIQ